METGSQRKWVSVGLLAIIIPVGLLVSFRLTGILQEPSSIETTIGETVEFRMERPTYTIHTSQWIENNYKNNETFAEFCVFLNSYYDAKSDYGGRSHLSLNITAMANVSQGFIRSMFFTFNENYSKSQVNLPGGSPNSHSYSPPFYTVENLAIEEAAYCFDKWWMLQNNTKAYVKAIGIDQPKKTYFNSPAHWILPHVYSKTHQLAITLVLTYWNTSSYKGVVLPISLGLQPDSGGFEDATVLTSGLYEGFSQYHEDREDYYKVWLEQSHAVQLEIGYIALYNRTDFPKVDMYLCDPELKVRASDLCDVNATGQITFTADSTGWWYIEINRASNFTYYLYAYILNISITRG